MTRRRVTHATCPRCGAPVLVGLDAPTAALTARVDAEPLPDHRAELRAVVDGARTYTLHTGTELHRRDQWAIARPGADVHAEHRCGHAPIFATRPDPRPPLPDTPPY